MAPDNERKNFVIAGAVLFAIISILSVIFTFTTPDGPRQDTNGQLQEPGGAPAHIIPRPNSGAKPQQAGDRGGWLQITLGILLFASVFGGAGYLWWWSRKAGAGEGRPSRSLSQRPRTNDA